MGVRMEGRMMEWNFIMLLARMAGNVFTYLKMGVHHAAYRILVPPTKDQTYAPAVGTGILTNWPARGFPGMQFKTYELLI